MSDAIVNILSGDKIIPVKYHDNADGTFSPAVYNGAPTSDPIGSGGVLPSGPAVKEGDCFILVTGSPPYSLYRYNGSSWDQVGGSGGGGGIAKVYHRNLSYSALTSASSTHSNYPQPNGIDGVENSMFATVYGTPPPHWYELDLKSPKEVGRWVYIVADMTDYPAGRYGTDFQLQYFDGATWVTADNVVGNSLRVIDHDISPVTAQLWRIYWTAGAGDTLMRVVEFKLMGA